ncbi:hypothetical protein [Actinomyces trachealis]|uniref:hypothetical protein n=1 Tax=Actinomyces trachealis TaxID=2763540 RepID=UPI001892BB50|nr:hypothetical protein [Actinomyces trachealis]
MEELKEVLSGRQVDAVDDRFFRCTAWMLSCTPMEVVRVAGGISDEVCRNGGCNWSGRHRRMLGDYRRILAYGAAPAGCRAQHLDGHGSAFCGESLDDS